MLPEIRGPRTTSITGPCAICRVRGMAKRGLEPDIEAYRRQIQSPRRLNAAKGREASGWVMADCVRWATQPTRRLRAPVACAILIVPPGRLWSSSNRLSRRSNHTLPRRQYQSHSLASMEGAVGVCASELCGENRPLDAPFSTLLLRCTGRCKRGFDLVQ